MKVFMPGATYWWCRYCGERFWWHPGSSNSKRPSECACGETKEPTMIIRIEEPVEGEHNDRER